MIKIKQVVFPVFCRDLKINLTSGFFIFFYFLYDGEFIAAPQKGTQNMRRVNY
jgi:hypothetical protein